jgi:hypothetical protein
LAVSVKSSNISDGRNLVAHALRPGYCFFDTARSRLERRGVFVFMGVD